jgi:hypothetical protein
MHLARYVREITKGIDAGPTDDGKFDAAVVRDRAHSA